MDQASKNTQILYEELGFGDFSYGKKREKFDSFLFNFLSRIKKSDNLFEIGCGCGYYFDTYLGFGISKDQITAVDIAPSNISELKKKGYKAVCDDVLNLQFDDKISDFTICSGVIHHTIDPAKAFSELVRITKKEGYIYLNVYNKWHPFFYIVHRLTYPIRYCYWNWTKKIIDIVYPLSKIFFQPIAYLTLGEFLDDRTGKIMFLDQVITPNAHLFSKSDLRLYAKKNNCEIEEFKYNRYFLMLAARIKVN